MDAMPSDRIEMPSGKGSGDENFPVGSFLISRRLRPHVTVYYAFARAIDDIADSPGLAPEEKISRLDDMDRALIGETGAGDPAFDKAHQLRRSLLETGVDFAHGRDLVIAFKQDAVKSRYATWDELIDYCNHSAAPVGRYLLELHGEDKDEFRYSDALCNALQIINHLQDCADDYGNLGRVYLPQDWMDAEGVTADDLARESASAGLRKVLDRCLAGTDELMRDARKLPSHLVSHRLAMESGVIVKIAQKLIKKLRRSDPVARRVQLSKGELIRCGVLGALSGLAS